MKSSGKNVPCWENAISMNLLTFTQRIIEDTLSLNISSGKFDKIFSKQGNVYLELS